MLALERKQNGIIYLRDGETEITIEVLAIRRGKVRLGISAPPGVKVLRDDCKNTEEKARPAT